MDETVDPRQAQRRRRLTGVVAATVLAGLGTTTLVVALAPARPAVVPPRLDRLWLAVLLLAVTVASELTAVRLPHGPEDEGLTLLEAAAVANVLLLPPDDAMLVTIVGAALACAFTRRGLQKSLFNVGAHAVGVAVLTAAVAVGYSRPPHAVRPVLSSETICAALVGTIGFAAVNLVLLAWVLSAAAGVPPRVTIAESWRLSLVMAVGTCGLGTMGVVIILAAPAALPFALLPAGALHYAYRAAATERTERDRSSRLLALSQVLAGRLVADDLLSRFLRLLRETYAADAAQVILEGDEEHPGAVVVAHAGGVDAAELTALDAALLARTGAVAELVDEGLPPDWNRTLLAPLEAEGRRLGTLLLVSSTHRPLAERDLAVLTPLVSALGVALRGAEHLARLVEETNKLKAVVEHSTDGILVLDGTGTVLVWNPAMETLSGLSASVACGRRLGELLPVSPGKGSAGWPRLTSEAPRGQMELTFTRPDGEQRWVRASYTAVFDGDAIVQTVVLVADVTRERQVERLKADFIATVSHELRTPLTPIKGYVELLRRRGPDLPLGRQQAMLDTVADRVAHLARLVEDLLLASRMSEPRALIRLQRDDLGALVRRSLEDFAGERDRLVVDVPEQPLPVRCDPTRVIQVVANLVSNALKYSPPPAPVHVTCRDADGLAVVEVRDAGRGIPADELERIFEKFHRLEDPLRMTTSGSGLGLYIARQLAEAMGGTLTADSVLGTGSTFTFRLPLLAGVPDVPGPRGATTGPATGPVDDTAKDGSTVDNAAGPA